MCLTLTDIVVLRSSYAADSPSVEEASIYKNWKKTSSDLWIRSVSDRDLVLRFFWTFLIPNGVWCVEFFDDTVYHQLFQATTCSKFTKQNKKKNKFFKKHKKEKNLKSIKNPERALDKRWNPQITLCTPHISSDLLRTETFVDCILYFLPHQASAQCYNRRQNIVIKKSISSKN